MRRVLRALRACTLPLALGAAGCQSCGEASGPDKVDAGTPKVEQVLPGERVLHPLIDGLASCDIDHRGKHVDLGSPAASGRFGFVLGEPPASRTSSTTAPPGPRCSIARSPPASSSSSPRPCSSRCA